jgi:ubiquinone/menaquinone biosynthesis C-methylase UbiE
MSNIFIYYQRILGKILEYYNFNGHEILIDIGCGDGNFSQILSKFVDFVVGIDIVPNLNWKKIKEYNIQFVVADARKLPFINESFDISIEKDALHHIKDHHTALKEIIRILKKNGLAIFIEANRYNPILYIHMTLIKHHEHFTKNYFKNLISSVFKDVSFTSIESHVYPIGNEICLKILAFLEDFITQIPFLNNILSYNIAIAKK